MLLYEELSNNILQAYFNVFKHLTTGLLESVYENALCIEFDEIGIPYERQQILLSKSTTSTSLNLKSVIY
jgi:GxxExxY protein